MFVYLITNTINGKRYIGQTKQTLAKRWNMHVSKNHCRYLYSAIQKYGRENFIIEVLFDVPTKELANEFEIEYIDRYRTMFPNGYNILPGGDDRPPMSDEAKKKISEQHKGKKHRLGHSPSEETRKKLSLANKGKTLSLEHRKKISDSHLGIGHSEESRRMMSIARVGKKHSEETRKKMSLAQKGKKRSEESRQNMKLAQQARRLKESNVGPRPENSAKDS
jgi:group I intron endonuclease